MCTASYDVWGYVVKHHNLLGVYPSCRTPFKPRETCPNPRAVPLRGQVAKSLRRQTYDAERYASVPWRRYLGEAMVKEVGLARRVNILVCRCCEASRKTAMRIEESIHNSRRRRKEDFAFHMGARRAIILSWLRNSLVRRELPSDSVCVLAHPSASVGDRSSDSMIPARTTTSREVFGRLGIPEHSGTEVRTDKGLPTRGYIYVANQM